ncbi:MAG: hypothetical protein JO359_06715, partial [Candidatus Eremiobacteraeota bacterium]|nr:hypothetical protein [Candidatus Eremiobacteraeota bacterium]
MPVVPGYVPFGLLVALEAVAVLVLVPRRSAARRELLLCARCAGLHERTERFARVADALAVGALAFLVSLPFVAAGFESGFSVGGSLVAVSATLAVVALGAEACFLARSLAAQLWPRLSWSVEPVRLVGAGARLIGALLALYLFQPGPGLPVLFDGVGKRLASDLAATWPIYAAAAILVA